MSSANPARVAATTESDFQSFSTVRLKPLLRFISAECLASFPASSPDIADFVIQLLTANKELVNQMCRGSTGSVLPEKPSHASDLYSASLLKCKAAVSNASKRQDVSFLQRIFSQHSCKADAKGGLSLASLTQALADAGAPVPPDFKVLDANALSRFDSNRNGVVDFDEFVRAVNAPDELALFFREKQLPALADALRALVAGRGQDQLLEVSKLSPEEMRAACSAVCSHIPHQAKSIQEELQHSFAAQVEKKTEFVLRGGSLEDYHDSLQALTGVPAFNLDDEFLLKQMEQEHCVMTGCNTQFECSLHYEAKDGTSKPTTTAKQEWDYVVNFKQDAPPSYLEGFKLKKMYKERKADRFVHPEEVKLDHGLSDAERLGPLNHGLSDAERLGLALYTGPMYKVYNDILRRRVLPSSGIHKHFLGNVEAKDVPPPDAQDANSAPSTSPIAWGALQAVYDNAQFLRLKIFGKTFDQNSDMSINRKELNKVIIDLLESKRLDDSMMRTVDFFSTVDGDQNGAVDLKEAICHCFPHLLQSQLDILLKWLHPELHDKALCEELKEFAMSVPTGKDVAEVLESMMSKCEDILKARVSEADRYKELQGIGKGFVSKSTLASILKELKASDKLDEKAIVEWIEGPKQEARKVTHSSGPNLFPVTIFAISSAIQKISRHPSSQGPLAPAKFFRGLNKITVPEDLTGYCEFGFLSSSRSAVVAESVACESDPDATNILIFEIEAPIGGFANIKQYSQFPEEEEFIFAPTSFIKFMDRSPRPERVLKDGGSGVEERTTKSGHSVFKTVRRVHVFPCVAPTIDSLREQEKMMHLQLFRFNRAELSQMLENRLRGWLKNSKNSNDTIVDVDKMPLDDVHALCDLNAAQATSQELTGPVSTKEIFERILFQYDEVLAKHQKFDHTEYGKDDFFRQRTSEMMDNKRWCEHKLELWLQNRENDPHRDLAIGTFFHPLERCFKIWITNLRRLVAESRAEFEESASPHEAKSRLQARCSDFLKAKCLIPSIGIELGGKVGILLYLKAAAVNGWSEEDLLALLELCDNVQGIIIQPIESKHSCLHIAAASGNSYFIDTVFSYICKKSQGSVKTEWKLDHTIVHNQGGDDGIGESPLYLASKNGHSNCIEVLVRFCPKLPRFVLSPLCVAISRTHVSCIKLLVAFALEHQKGLPYSLINDASHGFTPLMRALSHGNKEIVDILLSAGADESEPSNQTAEDRPAEKKELLLQQSAPAIRHSVSQRRSSISAEACKVTVQSQDMPSADVTVSMQTMEDGQ